MPVGDSIICMSTCNKLVSHFEIFSLYIFMCHTSAYNNIYKTFIWHQTPLNIDLLPDTFLGN